MEETNEDYLDKALARCEDEPIHIPGCIQPHGYLLILCENDLSIGNISANVADLLAIDVAAVLGKPLAQHFDDHFVKSVASALSQEFLVDANPLDLSVRGQAFDGV